MSRAIETVRALDLAPAQEALRKASFEVADIVRSLDADDDLVIAALIQPLRAANLIDARNAEQSFGGAAAGLAADLIGLERVGFPPDWTPEHGLEPGQAEALRKMLLALVGDVRLVIVRLAEQLQRMRAAKTLPAAAQRRLAIETREVYAPLANRLGVWQIKWELEDLAFRYLEPEEYRRIALALKARRSERERYIDALKSELQAALGAAGIEARIEGRPKHIFSIWRKMQSKHLAFEQLTDIRAARVLVGSVADCYAALGIVHSLWRFIPGEFDDYIATPKHNLYRSIHTAVLGPGEQPVEIQIRTHEMHANAEQGIASHWRYKEGGREDRAYARKIDQLRALLAPAPAFAAGGGGDGDQAFLERIRVDLFQDRVYLLSPRGEIIDVPVGGTPLDFAYQVHTDLGHRTRGAKVDGRMVPLDYRLKNGESVEIIAGKSAQPSRDWLSPQSGYLASARHRNKVRAWFRKQDAVPETLSVGDAPTGPHARDGRNTAPPKTRAIPEQEPEVAVQGVGNLLSSYARCCKPVPPEPIAGYVTVGRGVSIHAQSCANLARLSAKAPARLLAVDWGTLGEGEFAVDIEVQAYDRRGLVRDVSGALADEKISIQGMHTVTDRRDEVAHMRIGISISGLAQLSRVLTRISQLPSVISARRRR